MKGDPTHRCDGASYKKLNLSGRAQADTRGAAGVDCTQSFSNLSHLSDEADHTCRHLGRGRAAAATIRCLIRCAEEERKEWEDKVGKEGEGGEGGLIKRGEILESSNAQTCHVHLTRRMTQSSNRHRNAAISPSHIQDQ